jgi:glutamine amidotransferase
MGRKVGGNFVVSGDPQVIAGAAKLILPGIGSFDEGMKNLEQRGLIDVLRRKAINEKNAEAGYLPGGSPLARSVFQPQTTGS